MEKLNLSIVTPTRSVFSGQAENIRVPGYKSELGILPQHADLLGLTITGLIRFDTEAGAQVFAVRQGFLKVSEEGTLVMAEEAKSTSEKDEAKIGKELSEVEAKLMEASTSIDERPGLFAKRDWLQALQDL